MSEEFEQAEATKPEGNDQASHGLDFASLGRDFASLRDRRPVRMLIVTLILIAGLLVFALVTFIVLSNTPIFTITSIDTQDTEHLTKENIAKLASVEEGTTLLTIDEGVIEENLKRNPWVGSVQFVREFPDRLKITVTERQVDSLVKMSTGSVAWCLGYDKVWIEPINLPVASGQAAEEVALTIAHDMSALLIIDVPASMSPVAGTVAADEVLKAIWSYREQFSKDFNDQIVRFSAASVESIACTLSNGVEISLGSPSSIDVKESLVREILSKHPNQVTYINVRVPTQPSYRKLDSDAVVEGSGVKVEDVTSQDEIADTPPEAVEGDQAEGAAPATPDGSYQEGDGSGAYTDDGSGQDQWTDDSYTQDTSNLILGDDGIYYTYEQYYGLD